MKRLFIAINLPQKVKDGIEKLTKKISLKENGNWVSQDNWHLTISFLSYQPDEKIGLIGEAIKRVAKDFNPPDVSLDKIIYGPLTGQPKMVWITATNKTSQSLGEVKKKIEAELIKEGIKFEREFRDYGAHITLVRFRQPLQEKNLKLSVPVKLSFSAKSVDLMESKLSRSGAEYEVLREVDFK